MLRLCAAVLLPLAFWPLAASAQEEPPPSRCVAIAQALPSATYASFTAPKAQQPMLAEAFEYVLRGWNPDGGPARHALVVDDVYIRNVPTDIRNGGDLGKYGNSIFIFEVAGLCIGHLGHLHHRLEDAHYGAIGRLDVLMVPIDGGMTLSLDRMTEITTRLYSSMILPMHRHSTPISEFTGRMGDDFAVEFLSGRSLTVSLKTLPDRPTIVILEGV
ncbi:MBL fold metallo-hydrolase [Mesorhizobium sp.]|uniref:MBL fold metallo-hydrolase n=1 Tax=Mesorhizobium sp. TaxID=1871066 RepID=UPI0025EB2356|nr:MBL fold metallo-hydrolase [Mesorhizobium sp.]